jgi:vancomycin aglycone glucosyltransferase
VRILLSPIGSRGDVQPMLALGIRLRSRGHEVAICTARDFRGVCEQAGLGFRPIDVDAEALVRSVGPKMFNPIHFIRIAGTMERPIREGLDLAVRDVDVVVGSGAQPAARSYAEARGIRYLCAIYCPVGYRSPAIGPYWLTWQDAPRAVNRIAWAMQDRAFDFAIRSRINRLRKSLGLGPIGDSFDHISRTKPVLGAFDPLVAPPPSDFHDVKTTGFWFHDDPSPLPEAVERFLEAGEKPVYLGFGSMPSASRTGRVVAEALRLSGVRAIVGSGWGSLSVTSERVLTVGSVPHAKLFPRMAAIVHHGGAGTTAAATRSGVPQVIVPHLLDQYYWAHRVQRMGLGPRLESVGRATAAKLAAAIRDATSGRYDEAARAAGEALRATDGLAKACEILEAS